MSMFPTTNIQGLTSSLFVATAMESSTSAISTCLKQCTVVEFLMAKKVNIIHRCLTSVYVDETVY